ncbi:MAG: SAP domain-containing protein [Sulfobacillus sp.]
MNLNLYAFKLRPCRDPARGSSNAWKRDDLISIARNYGLAVSGTKAELCDRIESFLSHQLQLSLARQRAAATQRKSAEVRGDRERRLQEVRDLALQSLIDAESSHLEACQQRERECFRREQESHERCAQLEGECRRLIARKQSLGKTIKALESQVEENLDEKCLDSVAPAECDSRFCEWGPVRTGLSRKHVCYPLYLRKDFGYLYNSRRANDYIKEYFDQS